ncbi:hypothetical protein HY639_00410 [Candidatus Woesearchaeota archaeon]|nr:hypothetical protein [Candidatus Woesearchaeota archaeon]
MDEKLSLDEMIALAKKVTDWGRDEYQLLHDKKDDKRNYSETIRYYGTLGANLWVYLFCDRHVNEIDGTAKVHGYRLAIKANEMGVGFDCTENLPQDTLGALYKGIDERFHTRDPVAQQAKEQVKKKSYAERLQEAISFARSLAR